MSNIIYAPKSWNPIEGCTPISEGCRSCWALNMRRRFGGGEVLGQPPVTEPVLRPDRLEVPLHWRKPQTIAVAFMGDLWHDQVPDEFIDKVFAVMALTPQHTYLLLTKRPERMRAYLTMPDREPKSGSSTRNLIALTCLGMGIDDLVTNPRSKLGDGLMLNDDGLVNWPLPNVFLGVSCENQARADERIPLLLDTPGNRWLSLEPLLGPIDIRPYLAYPGPYAANRASWVVIGGESGPKARPCDLGWIRDINRQCKAAGVKRYIKQLGAKPVTDYYDEEMRNLYDERGLLWPDPMGWNSYRDGQPPLKSLVNLCGVVRDRKGENPDEWPPDLRVREITAAALKEAQADTLAVREAAALAEKEKA